MAIPYKINKRAYLCGDIMEEYIYETPLQMGIPMFDMPSSGIRTPKERTDFSLSRTRTHIRRMVNSNKDMDRFLTLTFAENVVDLDQAHYEFKKFRQKLQRMFKQHNFKYVAVVEFQKRGAIHYHLMCNIPWLSIAKLKSLTEVWGNGRIKLEVVRDKMKTGAYIAKYVNDQKKDIRYFARKIYFFSVRNLNKPICLVDNFIDVTLDMCYAGIALMQTYKIHSDYRGSIVINYYRLINKPKLC